MMMGWLNEILKEAATLEDIKDATGELVLLWVYRVEAKVPKSQPLMTYIEARDFDVIRQNVEKENHATPRMHKWEGRFKYYVIHSLYKYIIYLLYINTAAQGTHPSSGLHMARNLVVLEVKHFQAVCKLM